MRSPFATTRPVQQLEVASVAADHVGLDAVDRGDRLLQGRAHRERVVMRPHGREHAAAVERPRLVAGAGCVGDRHARVADPLPDEARLDDALTLGVGDALEQRRPVVPDLDWHPGCPDRSVDDGIAGARSVGHEPRGIVSKLELVDERESFQVGGRPDVPRIDSLASEEVSVVRHRFGRVPHGVAHALVAARQQLLARKVRGLPLTRHVPEHGQRPVTLLEEVHSGRTI